MLYTPDAILTCIAQLQRPDGLLPSERVNPNWRYKRLDINVFFTAITVFSLQRLIPLLSTDERDIACTILDRATAAYEPFRNKTGLKTYNFYQTNPSRHFPNGYLFRRFKHFQLPDDADDTTLIYLTTRPTPDELHWLKDKLRQHANLAQSAAPNTWPSYRNLAAYSTWFGKNMPIELDACVLSNVLYWVYEYNLPRNRHDADSLTFLRSIVEMDHYRTAPFRCAHNYARTSLIIYHLARFVAAFDPPELQSIRQKLVADAQQELERVPNRMDKILLATSLLRLGHTPPPVDLTDIEADFDGFTFFIAGLLSAYPQPWLYRHAHRPFWHIRWRCDAHNWTLVLEYTLLANP
ncbi:MAG: hypothetical protein H7Z72_20890 [Bacteroidetes bacterium]|nr:hypothetical protein [Fibrella sp.]